MDAKKEGRCDMFDQTNAGKERGMPIEDDDDDGDFKIVASIYEFSKKRTLIFCVECNLTKNFLYAA